MFYGNYNLSFYLEELLKKLIGDKDLGSLLPPVAPRAIASYGTSLAVFVDIQNFLLGVSVNPPIILLLAVRFAEAIWQIISISAAPERSARRLMMPFLARQINCQD